MRNIALESDPFGGRFLRGPALRRALLRLRGCLPASRAASVSSSPCVVDRMLHPRSHRFVRRRGSLCYFVVSCTVRGSIDEIACPRVAFSGPGKFIPFLTWSFETAAVGSHDSSMLFRKNCQNACANERDSIDEGSKADEMPHPGGEGRVGGTEASERSRGGTEAEEVPHPGERVAWGGRSRRDAAPRGSWPAARARRLACMQKNRGRLMVSKKNRYRTLKRRLFV